MPKILVGFFVKDLGWRWNNDISSWERGATEAQMQVCTDVPKHVSKLWASGSQADWTSTAWGQGVQESQASDATPDGQPRTEWLG